MLYITEYKMNSPSSCWNNLDFTLSVVNGGGTHRKNPLYV